MDEKTETQLNALMRVGRVLAIVILAAVGFAVVGSLQDGQDQTPCERHGLC